MIQYNRRRFLQGAAGAVALTVLPRVARADVNSQIRVATIGLNGRGKSHLDGFGSHIVALCDCDRNVLEQRASDFESKVGHKVDRVVDYRELLDRKDIDAISIATPNHTHALIAVAAAEAGKHVYCEKPVSQCLWEGRQIVNAARRYDRLIQCGTQSRSSVCNQQAVEYVRSGKLGKIKYAVGTCFKPRPSIGKLAQADEDSELGRLRFVVRTGGEGGSLSTEFALRLALGFQHGLRRHRQPGSASDGRGSLVSGRAGTRRRE